MTPPATGRERLEQLVGPNLASALVDAIRETVLEEQDASGQAPRGGYVSVQEAAGELGVSVRSVYRLVAAGQLEHRRVGERIVVARRALR